MDKPLEKNSNQEELKLAIFNSLDVNSNVSQRALANDLNVSLGSLNYCLKALISKGFVKVQNFRKSNNKLSYSYILTPKGIAQKLNLTKKFLKQKMLDYQNLQKEIKSLENELYEGKKNDK